MCACAQYITFTVLFLIIISYDCLWKFSSTRDSARVCVCICVILPYSLFFNRIVRHIFYILLLLDCLLAVLSYSFFINCYRNLFSMCNNNKRLFHWIWESMNPAFDNRSTYLSNFVFWAHIFGPPKKNSMAQIFFFRIISCAVECFGHRLREIQTNYGLWIIKHISQMEFCCCFWKLTLS